jgi:hypothetical protein
MGEAELRNEGEKGRMGEGENGRRGEWEKGRKKRRGKISLTYLKEPNYLE